MSNHLIELKGISKKFDTTDALNEINLYIDRNEFLTLLGPSGCGKSTLLRIIAGFENPTSGSVTFDGKDLLCIPPYKRKINTVFQKYALFSHMNVYENIAFGLKIKKVGKEKIDEKVKRVLKLVNLSGFEKRSVDSLSGGQQQRIAIARAIVNNPKLLLADEPTGALDTKSGAQVMELFQKLNDEGVSVLMITHDPEIAAHAKRVVMIRDGELQEKR